MSGWVRFENTMPENLKVAPGSDRAFRLWLHAICYCSRAQTDGFVPAALVTSLSVTATRKTVEELLTAGLFERVDAGYLVHNYLDYNPSRARISEMREGTRQRVADHRKRESNGVTSESETVLHDGYSHGRDRSDTDTSLVVDVQQQPKGRPGRAPSKPAKQDELPVGLPAELHDTARSVLEVLGAVQAERGGDQPTIRGVGLAMLRFPNRDYLTVAHEVEHWALGGRGSRKAVKDWPRTFGTFLGNTPEGTASRPAANVFPLKQSPDHLIRKLRAAEEAAS